MLIQEHIPLTVLEVPQMHSSLQPKTPFYVYMTQEQLVVGFHERNLLKNLNSQLCSTPLVLSSSLR